MAEELGPAGGEVTAGETAVVEATVVEAAVVEAAAVAGLVSALSPGAGMPGDSEIDAADAGATVAAVGVASESAGVVWALAGAAVNNRTRAKTGLLERLARVLLWLSIFLLLVSRQAQEALQVYQKHYRPLYVPICSLMQTVHHGC